MRPAGDTDHDQVNDFLMTLITIRPLDGAGTEDNANGRRRQFQIPVDAAMTATDLYDIVFSLTDIAPDELTLVHNKAHLPRDEQSLDKVGVKAPTVLEYGRIGEGDGSIGQRREENDQRLENTPNSTTEGAKESESVKADAKQLETPTQTKAQNQNASGSACASESQSQNPSQSQSRTRIDMRKLNDDMGLALGRLISQSSAPSLNRLLVNRLRVYHSQVLELEDKKKQATALKVLPSSDDLKRRMSEIRGKDGNEDLSESLLKTKAVLHWFKHECFQWVDKPSCWGCSSTPDDISLLTVCAPSASEVSRGAAARVEVYGCARCGASTRFARYEDPEYLLSVTQRGRCGEWAKAFALCVRALEIEARMVHDWTDHVWVEVWCDKERRWVHADACEDILDEPQLYESGWGKKLNYVIATSRHTMVDVTRRYVIDLDKTRERREANLEIGLARFLDTWNRDSWRRITDVDEKREIEMQWTSDIRDREKLTQKYKQETQDKKEGLGGRQSGSEQWVKSRGEGGSGGS